MMDEETEVARLKGEQVAFSRKLVAFLKGEYPDAFPVAGAPPVNLLETSMVLAVLTDITGGVVAVCNQLEPEQADATMAQVFARLLGVAGVYEGKDPPPGVGVVDI